MNKRKSITLLVISIVLILLLGVMTFCPVVVPLGNVDYHSPVTLIEYGLDLKGGYFVTFEVNKNELSDSEYAEGFDEVIDTLEDRMSLIESRMGIQGFTEALVASSPAEGLVSVEVPATESALSISDVFDILGSKGELVISLNEDGSEPFIPKNAQGDELTWNDCIVRADAIYDSSTSSYGIYVEFDDFGLEALKEGTSAITSSTPIYFILDGETISNPNVSSQITSNYSQITGLSTPVAAQTMAIQFMSGSYPLDVVNTMDFNDVGAELGNDAANMLLLVYAVMKSKITYHEQTDMENTLKLREVLKTLPSFTSEFFRGISTTTSTSTRIKYAYDLRIFFQYLQKENPELAKIPMDQMSVDVLDQVTALDLEEYTEYLKAYIGSQESYTTNGEKGLKRKLSALRTFYSYYFKKELIETNPTLLIDMPKLHEKEIIRLEPNEVAELLDFIESCGDGLSNHQRAYYEKTKERDFAIITLLLGTGIRVSECVGLDIEDVDFKNNGIKVLRKGGNEMFVYFGDEVAEALKKYIEVRAGITPVAGHEHALFYSAQRKRINVKTVENLVKKYASQVTTTKKITPHKLRSTYGTTLYQETGDIYLVADVLGHKDVNTTKKHYAAMDDARRRQAATAVRLRESMPEHEE